jgi:predicted signal transduction protein with EAL and GGDEF domain
MAGDAIHLLSQEASMESINSGHDRRANDDRRAGIPSSENAALLAALDRGEIEILFQPQFAAADGAVIGAEALVRWNQP